MVKSRKKRGGKNETPKSACEMGMSCPKITENGSSLMATVRNGIELQSNNNKLQSHSMVLARGGGKRKKGGRVICPQPPAGSGGNISTGDSSTGKNMCAGTSNTLQQNASSKFDSQAKDLDISDPKNPFEGGGKRKRRRRKKRKTRKKKSKTKKKKSRKTKRRKKSRKHRS